jgi:hypothetical protein
MRKKKTLIYEKTRGIFIGTIGNIAVFSRQDVLQSTKAFGFAKKQEAVAYVEKFMPSIKDTAEFIEIPVNVGNLSIEKPDEHDYIDVVDIIRAGYGKHSKEMFLNMPTNPTLH